MSDTFEILCPCCSAKIKVDKSTGTILYHEPPDKPRTVRDLDDAFRRLQEEAKKREGLFEKSLQAEKAQKEALDKKFEELLKQASKSPSGPMKRDIDLD